MGNRSMSNPGSPFSLARHLCPMRAAMFKGLLLRNPPSTNRTLEASCHCGGWKNESRTSTGEKASGKDAEAWMARVSGGSGNADGRRERVERNRLTAGSGRTRVERRVVDELLGGRLEERRAVPGSGEE